MISRYSHGLAGIRHLLGKARWQVIEAFGRRDCFLPLIGPVVSFTFDDFPQSALHVGTAILKKYGARGTYYSSMGLIGQNNDRGLHFCSQDLISLLAEGHELGSHTYSHLPCRSSTLQRFEEDVLRGKEAVERVTRSSRIHNFCYPGGHVMLRSKRRIGEMFMSCRGIVPGFNKNPVDLNLLRANSLYSSRLNMAAIEHLMAANERCPGWLIFYTHDVSENPSPFGCRPAELEDVVRLAQKSGAALLTVQEVILGTAPPFPDIIAKEL